MEDLALKMLSIVIGMFKAHSAVMVAATVASFLVMARPLLRALVEWTPNKVDNKILEVLLKVANLLTPLKTKRGANVVKAPDDEIIDNLLKEYDDPAQVPAFVLGTLTEAQQELLAKKYAEE